MVGSQITRAIDKERSMNESSEPSALAGETRWFLRPKDLAELTGLSASEVREAIYRGSLTARKYRRRGWLIEVAEARRWIEAETAEPAA